jgi:hypothetical protein
MYYAVKPFTYYDSWVEYIASSKRWALYGCAEGEIAIEEALLLGITLVDNFNIKPQVA